MKVYNKPTIEFIEIKPEERLACGSGCNSGSCSTVSYVFKPVCKKDIILHPSLLCLLPKFPDKCCSRYM